MMLEIDIKPRSLGSMHIQPAVKRDERGNVFADQDNEMIIKRYRKYIENADGLQDGTNLNAICREVMNGEE